MSDNQQRRVAAEIEGSHPQWMVLWGCHSRLFWAFPHFQAPPGTIVSAPDQDRLVASMRDIELRAGGGWPVPAYGSPAPAYGSPRGSAAA